MFYILVTFDTVPLQTKELYRNSTFFIVLIAGFRVLYNHKVAYNKKPPVLEHQAVHTIDGSLLGRSL